MTQQTKQQRLEQEMKEIETKRLLLRPWREEYAGDLFDYAKNPNVGPEAGWKPHEDIDESLKIIRLIFAPNDVWAISLKGSGKIIGSIGFEPDKRRPCINSKELGYSLSQQYWGRGIMTEAARAAIRYGFLILNLDIIAICTGPKNFRSQRIIQKCGFIYEGTERRAYKMYNGIARDTKCYSLLREEWEGR